MQLERKIQLSENLKALRKMLNLSQKDFSEKIGINRSTYALYEKGERLPDLPSLFDFATFYHLNIDTLITEDIMAVTQNFFMYEEYTRETKYLINLYEGLCEFSKGRLIERAEALREADAIQKRNLLNRQYGL